MLQDSERRLCKTLGKTQTHTQQGSSCLGAMSGARGWLGGWLSLALKMSVLPSKAWLRSGSLCLSSTYSHTIASNTEPIQAASARASQAEACSSLVFKTKGRPAPSQTLASIMEASLSLQSCDLEDQRQPTSKPNPCLVHGAKTRWTC